MVNICGHWQELSELLSEVMVECESLLLLNTL